MLYFMDDARYHTSKATKKDLKRLGLNVLFNSPENPCLNMAELFIRVVKAKIKA
jgi:transposase